MANVKEVMRAIVDGDKRMPEAIAEEQGFVGSNDGTSDKVREAVGVIL